MSDRKELSGELIIILFASSFFFRMPGKKAELREEEGIWHKVLMVLFPERDPHRDNRRGVYGFYSLLPLLSLLRGFFSVENR
ncbi:hypothetical protein ACWXV6_01060 [Pantoea ananatis]